VASPHVVAEQCKTEKKENPLPCATVAGTDGLHVLAAHSVVKPGDDEVWVIADVAASSLNATTKMEEVEEGLGDVTFGVEASMLNECVAVQGSSLCKRPASQQLTNRLMTYVNASERPSSVHSVHADMQDLQTIIQELMSNNAINMMKTEDQRID
jgi:hypothetical protein